MGIATAQYFWGKNVIPNDSYSIGKILIKIAITIYYDDTNKKLSVKYM